MIFRKKIVVFRGKIIDGLILGNAASVCLLHTSITNEVSNLFSILDIFETILRFGGRRGCTKEGHGHCDMSIPISFERERERERCVDMMN